MYLFCLYCFSISNQAHLLNTVCVSYVGRPMVGVCELIAVLSGSQWLACELIAVLSVGQ